LLLTGCSAALICACGTSSREGDARVRVVLITLDTLRFDRFEAIHGKTSAMPLTRSHAERGLVFRHFYTVSPVTQPAHVTFLTGLPPWEHGITRNGSVFSDRFPSIVETFKQNGFETRAIVASFPLARRFGFARGFDEFNDDFSHNLSENKLLWESHWKIQAGEFFALGNSITDRALAALQRATEPKQFFWFHYFDPHAPYGISSGAGAMRKKDIMAGIPTGAAAVKQLLTEAAALYDKDVRYLDLALDRLLRKLAEDEATYETHIVVVADHGESLGDGNSIGHGARLNEAELRVPAFVISPKVAAGVRNNVTSAIDIAPTLLSLAGLKMTGPGLPGRDLTAPPTNDSRAFAIRRTFREFGKSELRLDGEHYSLDEILFCEIDSTGRIRRGNRDELIESEENLTTNEHDRIMDSFRTFHEAYERMNEATAIDAEARRGLEALCYIQSLGSRSSQA
ncbi:MAG: sulfatase-like hydrolase/transferase, partial [Myxococcales bacterium]|nr:sulfatase-like hydrolase/transferase [Myxococcales bacterium]